MTKKPRIILFGKQGAGKGTQAALLVKHFGSHHLSTGDIFRAAIKEGTPAGKEAQSYIEQGQLVPDETVIKVVSEKFNSSPALLNDGFILDGFPRTYTQAVALDELLKDKQAPLHKAINIEVDREIVMKRITGRRVCVNCGAIYHIDNPPKNNWTCDICSADVQQRNDDTEDAIKTRLDLYEKETAPLLEYYEKNGLLEVVNGEGQASEVLDRILMVLDELPN